MTAKTAAFLLLKFGFVSLIVKTSYYTIIHNRRYNPEILP